MHNQHKFTRVTGSKQMHHNLLNLCNTRQYIHSEKPCSEITSVSALERLSITLFSQSFPLTLDVVFTHLFHFLWWYIKTISKQGFQIVFQSFQKKNFMFLPASREKNKCTFSTNKMKKKKNLPFVKKKTPKNMKYCNRFKHYLVLGNSPF